MSAPTAQQDRTIDTDIPERLDRLPWSKWHTRIIIALGTSWLLDGLEVTLVGSLAGILESKAGLHLTDQQVTGAATTYLAGAVLGALLFGYLLTDMADANYFLSRLPPIPWPLSQAHSRWASSAFLFFASLPDWGLGANMRPSIPQ